MAFSQGLVVYAFVVGSDPAIGEAPLAALALGLALVPVVFLVVAFGSRHPRAPTAVLHAMGVALLVGLPLAAVDVVTGLMAGFGAGGAIALAQEEDDSLVARFVAIGFMTLYVAVLLRWLVEAGVFGGAVLPLVTVAAADEIMERRARDLRRRTG